MGYALYTLTRNGEEIQAGYSVETICEQDECTEQIDRGLYYLCGDMPNSGHGCGRYFCSSHLYMSADGDWDGDLCEACAAKVEPEDEDDESEGGINATTAAAVDNHLHTPERVRTYLTTNGGRQVADHGAFTTWTVHGTYVDVPIDNQTPGSDGYRRVIAHLAQRVAGKTGVSEADILNAIADTAPEKQ